MIGRASTLRITLQAPFRRPVPPQWTRAVGRRGYASLQERVGQSSDRPWQLAALAVTVPGVLFLRRASMPNTPATSTASTTGHGKPGETRAMHSGPTGKGPKVETMMESPPIPQQGEVPEQKAIAAETEVTIGESDGAATPLSASSDQGNSSAMSTPPKSAEELTANRDSEHVEPTQEE